MSASFTQEADCAESSDSAGNLAQACVQGSPRLRGSDPAMAAAIEQAVEQSPTFRQLVSAINRTDGIVYVHYGACARNVRACLLLAVTQAGPHRILHIRVDRRRKAHDLMVVIGHELSHAVELLKVPTVIDATTAQNYYRQRSDREVQLRERGSDRDRIEDQQGAATVGEATISSHADPRAGGGVIR